MANRFWVGGSGNWSDNTNHWSTSSGGAPGASLPTVSDSVFFDANSGSPGAYTVTVDTGATRSCLDLNFSAAPSGGGTITWAGTGALQIRGNMLLLSGMTRTYTGAITMDRTTSGGTVTMNGVSLGGTITFSSNTGSSGVWTLQDAFTSTSGGFALGSGTLNTNNQTVTVVNVSFNTGTHTFNLGSSTLNVSGDWTGGSGLNAGTSTINMTGSSPAFSAANQTFNNVNFTAAGPGAGPNILGTPTIANLSVSNPTSTGINTLRLDTNITVTGTLTVAGGTPTRRVRFRSNTVGTARTITAAAVSLTDADFRDVTGAGAAAPFTGTRLGDLKGNSQITFTAAADKFWVGDSGVLSDPDWALTSGGAGSANNFPLPQDNIIFDANSFSTIGQSFTWDISTHGVTDLDASATDKASTSISLGGISLLGDLTLRAGLTLGAGTINCEGRAAQSLDPAGASTDNSFSVSSPGGTVTFLSSWSSTNSLSLTSGTLDLNDQAISCSSLTSVGSTTRALDLGASTITLVGTSGNVLNVTSTGLTLTAGTSTIIINGGTASAKTFAGGGLTYNNIILSGSGTGTFDFTGSNTFNDFANDRSIATTIRFTAATTTTVSSFSVSGSSGNVVTIGSITAANHNLAKSGGGVISCDWLSISRSQASPADTWYAGANSTDGGNNTGWIFSAAPSAGGAGDSASRRLSTRLGLGL